MFSVLPESYAEKCRRMYERTFEINKPRASLKFAVLEFKKEAEENQSALDLGCGVGNDALYMIENGWLVTAIDSQALAKEYLFKKIPKEMHGYVTFIEQSFETMTISSQFMLVNASRSLPFCDPSCFDSVMNKVLGVVAQEGRFAGHFGGPNDDWGKSQSAVILTEEEIRAYFKGFTNVLKSVSGTAHSRKKPNIGIFSVLWQKKPDPFILFRMPE